MWFIRSCLTFFLVIPLASWAADYDPEQLLTTVQLERSLHFSTPTGDVAIVPSGTYTVAAKGTEDLELRSDKTGTWLIRAMSGAHEEEIDRPLAVALPDEASLQLTHLILALPDRRSFQSTGSADGVMPRSVPTHVAVAMIKTLMTGSPVKPAMSVDQHSTRSGQPYRTYTLFAGMCTLLCERDVDCRAFNWTRNTAKPVTGSCQLMKDIPPKQDDDCCLSGAKPVAQKK